MPLRSIAVLLLLLAHPTYAETVWISDVVTVPLRSGPSLRNKILHAGLPSGTRLETLSVDEASGFTQVRLRDGTEGWVRSQYLTPEPIARFQLAAANEKIESLQSQLSQVRGNLQESTADSADAEKRLQELTERNQALEQELAEIKRISANAIALNAANEELKKQNAALEDDLAETSRTIASLERDVRLRWLLFGGGLVLIGAALGYALNSRRKRSSWA